MTKTMLRIGKETYGTKRMHQLYQEALMLYFSEEGVQQLPSTNKDPAQTCEK